MRKRYKKVDVVLGGTLEDCVNLLLECKLRGELACLEFNGHKLYSDSVTMDSAYLECTGYTKAEFDKHKRDWNDKLKKAEEAYNERISNLTRFYIEDGHAVLDKKYWTLWDDLVPARLCDLYRGLDLKCCLEIIQALNSGCDMSAAKEIVDGQGHSGLSLSLVKSMVKTLCDRGHKFAKYIEEYK